MAGSEEVDLRMSGNHPKTVLLALERLDRNSFVQVPHPDCLVLANRKNQILVRMEQARRNVLEVAATGVNLPSFRFYFQLAGVR